MQWMVPRSICYGSLSEVELFIYIEIYFYINCMRGGIFGKQPQRQDAPRAADSGGRFPRLVDAEVAYVRIKKYCDQPEKG